MARTFFRIQAKGIGLVEMQAHNSANGAGDEPHEGLAAADSVSSLRHYLSGWLALPAPEFEVVIFSGRKVGELYDGILTYPETIILRVEVEDFLEDDSYCDLESW